MAVQLRQLQKETEEKQMPNVRFALVGTEMLGFQEFLENKFFPPEDSFVDTTALLHRTFSRPLGMGDVAKGLLTWNMWSRMSSAPKGNTIIGKDQYYMDGMLVVGGPEGKVYHAAVLDKLSDQFDFKEVMNSVNDSIKENASA